MAISEKFRAAVRDQRRILDAYLGNLDRAREHLCKLAKWHEEMCFAGADSTEFMDFYRVMDDAAVLVSRIPQKSGLWSATPPYVPLWRARYGLNIAYEQARILNNCIDLLEDASRDFCALARRHAAWAVGLDGEKTSTGWRILRRKSPRLRSRRLNIFRSGRSRCRNRRLAGRGSK